MKNISRAVAATACMWLFATIGSPVRAQQANLPAKTVTKKEEVMTNHASGTFEVKITPLTTDGNPGDPQMGRMSIDKQFHGDIEGVSKGEMLTGMSAVEGSGSYVAIEKVTGKLKGRTGTFILAHTGTMTRGTPHLVITVVPDSGTGELAGLTGMFTIKIDKGNHSFEFEYTLEPDKKD